MNVVYSSSTFKLRARIRHVVTKKKIKYIMIIYQADIMIMWKV